MIPEGANCWEIGAAVGDKEISASCPLTDGRVLTGTRDGRLTIWDCATATKLAEAKLEGVGEVDDLIACGGMHVVAFAGRAAYHVRLDTLGCGEVLRCESDLKPADYHRMLSDRHLLIDCDAHVYVWEPGGRGLLARYEAENPLHTPYLFTDEVFLADYPPRRSYLLERASGRVLATFALDVYPTTVADADDSLVNLDSRHLCSRDPSRLECWSRTGARRWSTHVPASGATGVTIEKEQIVLRSADCVVRVFDRETGRLVDTRPTYAVIDDGVLRIDLETGGPANPSSTERLTRPIDATRMDGSRRLRLEVGHHVSVVDCREVDPDTLLIITRGSAPWWLWNLNSNTGRPVRSVGEAAENDSEESRWEWLGLPDGRRAALREGYIHVVAPDSETLVASLETPSRDFHNGARPRLLVVDDWVLAYPGWFSSSDCALLWDGVTRVRWLEGYQYEIVGAAALSGRRFVTWNWEQVRLWRLPD